MKLTQGNLGKAILPRRTRLDHIFWDDDLPGFGLRIREGGSRNYVVQYKVGKKTRRMVIGSVKRLTPEVARKQAKKELGKVSLGRDPQGEKAATKATATETLGAMVERFLSFQAKRLPALDPLQHVAIPSAVLPPAARAETRRRYAAREQLGDEPLHTSGRRLRPAEGVRDVRGCVERLAVGGQLEEPGQCSEEGCAGRG